MFTSLCLSSFEMHNPHHTECFVYTRHPHRHWYKIFCTQGCVLVENGAKTRYTGEENKNLLRAKRAERFTRYVKECCNIHHGRDTTYLHQVFFPKHHVATSTPTPTKRRRKTEEKKKVNRTYIEVELFFVNGHVCVVFRR